MKFSGLFFILFALVLGFVFYSCIEKEASKQNNLNKAGTEVLGLCSIIKLNIDTTLVPLEDYFMDPNKIEIIETDADLKIALNRSSKMLEIIAGKGLQKMGYISFNTKHTIYQIPFLRSGKEQIDFTFNPSGKDYSKVQIRGEMNAWNAAQTNLIKEDGIWKTTFQLEPGTYAYLLVLDGEEQLDPAASEKMSNGTGGWNSKMVVGDVNNSVSPKIITSSIKGKEIRIKAKGKGYQYLAFWQNQVLTGTQNEDSYLISIPDQATEYKRSFIRIWAYDAKNISNDILIPVKNGSAILQTKDLNRTDIATNNIYFAFVDRFENGEKENDKPLNDPKVAPLADYLGGDLRGIINKIESGYFKDMGTTALWISPILKNPSTKYGFYNKNGIQSEFSAYHGYWPISFSEIDDHFGTESDFNELVEKAHANNLNVYLDFVAHHVHEESPVYQNNKDNNWTTELYLPDGTLNTEKWDEHRLTTWFDIFLPTFNFMNPEVTDSISNAAIALLKNHNLDGFRHDATKHIPLVFWRELTKKVKKLSLEQDRAYYQIGETYGSPELIGSYVGSGMLDAQFDFNLYDAVLSAICKKDIGFGIFKDRMKQSLKIYGNHHFMGNMTGNQDKTRFMALATGDIRFDENGKDAGWSRDIQLKTEAGYAKLGIMHAIIQSIPGVPVTYYGDEIGLTGGNDPDNRRMMKFDGLNILEQTLKKKVAKCAKLRQNNMSLLYGDFNFLPTNEEGLAYVRNYFDNTSIICINNSKEPKRYTLEIDPNYDISNLKGNFGAQFSIEGRILILELPAHSFEILTNNS